MVHDEEWRAVCTGDEVFRSRYQVSNYGRVRTSPDCSNSWGCAGKVRVPSLDTRGYPQVTLSSGDGAKWRVKVHRLVADAFLGVRHKGQTVNHKDGDKTNNMVENLELVSTRENNWHALRVIRPEKAIVVYGEPMCIPEAIARYGALGVHTEMVARRVKREGWTPERALSTPPDYRKRPKSAGRTRLAGPEVKESNSALEAAE